MLIKNSSIVVVSMALLGLSIFLFIAWPSSFYFLNDDFIHIPSASEKNFLQRSLIRPLSDFTLWLDHLYWVTDSTGYHITNISIHITNSILVFFATTSIYSKFSEKENFRFRKSFASALIFLIYAFHSESLFWIIGRGGSLSTLFFLLAFIFYQNKENHRSNYVLSLFFFTIGLLAYESIWAFPLITSITFFLKPDKTKSYLLGVWLLFIFYLIIRFYFFSVPDEYEMGAFNSANVVRLMYNLNTLAARCFLPPMSNTIVFTATYIFLFAILSLFLYKSKNKLHIYLLLCLFFSLAPVVSLGIDTHDSESERFIYLPSFFAVIVIIELFLAFSSRGWIYLCIIFFLLHACWLSISADNYKVGGLAAKKSLECIGIPQNYNTIYAINLPSQNKGALIFRKGFGEALNWIKEISYDSLVVVSTSEYSSETFQCINKALLHEMDIRINKQLLFTKYDIQPQHNDAVFYWNKDQLHIIR